MNLKVGISMIGALVISIFFFLQISPTTNYNVPLKNYRDTTKKEIIYTNIRQGGSSTYHRSTSNSTSYSSSSTSYSGSRSYSGGSYSYGK